MLFINDQFCACKGMHSDTLCGYALVLLGSRGLLSLLLALHKHFIALVL